MKNENDKVLSKLAKAMNPAPVQQDEYTIAELLRQPGMKLGREAIRYKMEKLVKARILTRRKAGGIPGHAMPCVAYKPVDGKTWDDVIEFVNS